MDKEIGNLKQFIKTKKIGVIGFGVSGRYITDALIKLGVSPVVFEKKKFEDIDSKNLIIELREKKKADFVFNYTDDDLRKADLLILSSGVKPDDFSGYDFISELDFVCSFLREYIFITGTKGKGTTLLLTGAIFRKAGINHFLGGNIGEGDLYSPSAKAIDYPDILSIFEVSSFQLKSTNYASPVIHAITNLGIDHLDWHKDIQDYWWSKLKICERSSICIAPLEIEETIKKMTKAQNLFLVGRDIYFDGKHIKDKYGRNFEFKVEKFLEFLPGKHNINNLLVAFSIFLKYCDYKNIKIEKDILDGILEFVPKRKYVLEFEGEYAIKKNEGGIKKLRFYNDSLSTNPLSVKSAIESFDDTKKIILICGGLAKGFDFSSIRNTIQNIKLGILIGASSQTLSKDFKNKIVCKTLEEAIEKSIDNSEDGDIILFSPGCASFDMFRSAKERGKIFSEKLKEVISRINKNQNPV